MRSRAAGIHPRIAYAVTAVVVIAACSATTSTVPPATGAPDVSVATSATASASAAAAVSDTSPGTAELTVLSDTVWAGPSDALQSALDGDVLEAGDTVHTDDGRAIVTFSDGSTVEIEPFSEITIDQVADKADGGILVALTQALGQTWHVVSHLGASSSYQVHTDASTASVRGTAFQVGVDVAGGLPVATIQTAEGTVATTAKGAKDEVLVPHGSLTTVKKGDARPAAPKAAPEPERKATVTVGDENSLVVDAAGRSNGFKDGKLVLQTPGAHAEKNGSKVTVSLPDPPDGVLTTVVSDKKRDTEPEKIDVETKIEERGGSSQTVRHSVGRGEQGMGGVELKKSGGHSSVRALGSQERSSLKRPKTGNAPKRGSGHHASGQHRSPRPGARRSGGPARSGGPDVHGSRPPGAPGGPQGSRPPGAPERPSGSRPPGAPEGSRPEGRSEPPGGARPGGQGPPQRP